MRLIQLTKENINSLYSKKVYCIEKTVSYLEELFAMYPEIELEGIFDNYRRNIGEFIFRGKNYWVKHIDKIAELDLTQAVLLITSDYYKEAYQKVADRIAFDGDIYFFPNKETEYDLAYRAKYADMPLRDIILFRSGPHASGYVPGLDFADNSKAVFEYMISHNMNEQYKLVWLVKNAEDFADLAKKYKNVSFISYDWSVSEVEEHRNSYYENLCLAKFIFMTDAYGFCRNAREDQMRVQLWHGCGFKSRTNDVSCEKRYEYIIVTGEIYRTIYEQCFGLKEGQVKITGQPKTDCIYHPADRSKMEELGIPAAKKYIFWLPTFRKAKATLSILNETSIRTDIGLPIIYDYEELTRVNNILKEAGCVLVIKLHPFQDEKEVHCDNLSNIRLLSNDKLLKAGLQINQILGWADGLISDYSSVAVDYLLLDRPVGFTVDDVGEFESNRGFIFENIKESLPGKIINIAEEFESFIREVAAGEDTAKVKRQTICAQMHTYKDDLSSERVLREICKLDI